MFAGVKPLPPVALVFSGLFFLLLAGLVFLFSDDSRLSGWFVGGVAAAWLLFRGMAALIRWLAGKAPRLPLPSLRVGVASIHRPGSPGVSLVFALGFGLTALVAVVMVNASLDRSLSVELTRQAPAFFFMDIRGHEADGFREAVLSVTALKSMPPLKYDATGTSAASRARTASVKWWRRPSAASSSDRAAVSSGSRQ